MKQLLFLLSTLLILHASPAAATPAPVPQTGQTLCYNSSVTVIPCAGTGQDGDLQTGVVWPNLRFTDNSLANLADLTVTDNLTGLIWTKDANAPGPAACGPATAKIWQSALDYAACLNTYSYLGYDDWRVPSVRELGSLVDALRYSPSLPVGHPFTAVQSRNYWSSTSVNTTSVWRVDMGVGYVGSGDKILTNYVWPVRSGQTAVVPALTPKTGQTVSYAARDDGALQPGVAWPSPRFSDNLDGTVTDNLTDLTWLKTANCFGSKYWSDALTDANSLTSGSCGLSDDSTVGDWHLPNKNELWSLVDYGRSNPALLAGHPFSNVQGSYYWSGTTYADGTGYAWLVGIYSGDVDYVYKFDNFYVWPVRSGQFWSLDSLTLSIIATDYGNVAVGMTAAPRQVRLKNSGTLPVAITAITLTGADPAQFSVAPGGNMPCSSLTPVLAAGTSCTMAVSARPTTSGAKNANLTVATAGGSQDIPLTVTAYSTVTGTVLDMATGLPLAGATVTLSSTPVVTTGATGTYSFGQLPDGTYSITVSKTGYQPVTVSNLSVSSSASGISTVRLPTIGTLNMPAQTPAPANLTQAYSYYTRVTGGTWPYTFSLAEGSLPLPAGITLNTATGELTGTPTTAGQYDFSIGVRDTANVNAEVALSLNVAAPLRIVTAVLPAGEATSAYTATISKTGGSGSVTFAVTNGALPTGLTLNGTSGVISGTPTTTGSTGFMITASDAAGRTAATYFTITIAPTLTITTTRLNDTLVGSAYSQALTGIGGQPPYSWEIVSGTLPSGLTLNLASGAISGTATVAGSPSITFGLRDVSTRLVTKALTLNVVNPVSLVSSVPNAIVGSSYTQALVSGGLAPFSCSISSGNLPAGLTLNSTTCVISGLPTIPGLVNFDSTVSDSTWPTPQSGSKSLSIRTLPATYTLSADITGSGSGSVHSSPVTDISCIKGISASCSALFATGSVVTLTATADSSSSTFGGWSNACATVPCAITMNGNKTATATFTLAPRIKLALAATSGYDTLPLAYGSAASTIFALEGLFAGGWTLGGSKDIILKGGYLADYGPVRNGFTTVGSKLTITNGSLRVDGVKVSQ
jgi:hypothetical protein